MTKTKAARRRPIARVREHPSSYTAFRVTYVESSALVRALLDHDSAVASALDAPGRHVTSAVTFAEAQRALVRARVAGQISAKAEAALSDHLESRSARFEILAVTDGVLTRAGRPFPVEPVRTLDAIHLATLELLGEPPQLVRVVTRDERVAANARALGYAVV
ncbi:MAG: type II toxin-antitoxin system VapC family toxin [Gemmatimonadales bacterium]